MRPAALRSGRAAATRARAAALLAGVPADASAPSAPSAAGAATQPLRIGSYNIRAGVAQADFEAAVTAFKPMADVFGLQEIGATDRGTFLGSDSAWGHYRPPALQQNPILWDRSKFDFVGAQGYMIAKERDLHGEHSGDGDKGDSWATIVRLVQRSSGQQLSFINVHLVRGAIKGGQPAPDKPNLFQLYVDQLTGTLAAVKQERALSDTVYVLGDFNIGWEADFKRQNRKLPYKRFKAIGFRSMWQGSPLLPKPYGTHQDALIDQVWTVADSTSEVIVRDLKASDHSPTVATYAVPVDPGYTATTGTVGFDLADLDQSDKEGDAKARECDLSYRLVGDLAHGAAEIVFGGTATKGDKYGQGDYLVDLSSFYDNDLSDSRVCIDFQGDTTPEPDETITLTLVPLAGTTTVLPGQSMATGTIRNND